MTVIPQICAALWGAADMNTPEIWCAVLLFEGVGEFPECMKQPGAYLTSREALAAAIKALEMQPYAIGATAIKAKEARHGL